MNSIQWFGKRLSGMRAAALAAGLMLGASGTALAALTASVTVADGQPTLIYPGDTTQLQITLSNSNTAAAITGVGFSNSLPGTLPNGLKIVGAATYTCTNPATSGTAAGAGTLTADVGTQAIQLSGGTIPARANNTDGTCVITIPVTAGSSTGNSASYQYSIASGAVTGNDGQAVSNSGAVSQSIDTRQVSRPVVSKQFGANPTTTPTALTLNGAAVTLTITVSNPNVGMALTNFSLTDAFPQLALNGTGAMTGIIKVAATPNATSSCNNTGGSISFNPVAGDTTLTATGTVPAKSGTTNGQCTLTVQVEGNHTGGLYDTGSMDNTIAPSQLTNDQGLQPSANAFARVKVLSPLQVTKAFAKDDLSSGQSSSLTVTLTNSGNADLTVTTFTDDPIDGTTAGNTNAYGLKVTGGSTTCAGGSVAATANNTGFTLTGGTIPANGSCTVTANFTATVQTPNTPSTYTNTLVVGAVGNTAGIVSQSATDNVRVVTEGIVVIDKSAGPNQAGPGNSVRYVVTVRNITDAAITNVVLTDHLLHGLTYLTGNINGNDFTPQFSSGCAGPVTGGLGATDPAFTFANIPANSNCKLTFWAMADKAAANNSSTSNTINVGDVCYNNGATCNSAASNTTTGTVTTSVLRLTKAFAVDSLSEGEVTRMTLTLSNWSVNPLTDVSVTDNLPLASGSTTAQMRIANPANASTTCGGSPVITAVPGATSLTMTGASITKRFKDHPDTVSSCTLTVDVTGPAGAYVNTASATATETYADNSGTHALGPVEASDNLTYTSALSATKSFSPSSVASGGRSTVTIHLNNVGTAALTNVSVADSLPPGMSLADPVNAYSTCAGTPTFDAPASTGTFNMTGGATIPASGGCDVLFDVKAVGGADWVNTIPVGNITAAGGIFNQEPVAATLAFSLSTNISITKTTSPSTLTFPGQVSQLTISIANGSQAVSNLAVTDYFTANGTASGALNGMAVAPNAAASTTCPGGIVSTYPGATFVSLSGAALGASETCEVTLNVTTLTTGGIDNIIPAGAIRTDQGLTNAFEGRTSLTTSNNLGVAKRFTPNVVKVGERSRLKITLYNPTAQAVTNLSVTDDLPANVTVPADSNPQTTCAGATVSAPTSGQVRITGGSMAAGEASCHAEIDVLVGAQGDYTNTIAAGQVTATVGGSSAQNNQPTSDVLRAKSPLVVHKAINSKTLDAGDPVGFTTGADTVAPGTEATLTIRLDNPNNADLTHVAFTDTLPTGLVVGQAPINASTTCANGVVVASASGTSVRLAGATVPANGSCTVSVDVLSNISGTYTNTLAVGAVTSFEGVGNEAETRAQVLIATPPVVVKQFTPAVIPANGTASLTITLSNDNPGAITLTDHFTDTLPTAPGQVSVATPLSASTTCRNNADSAAASLTNASNVALAAGHVAVRLPSGSQIPAGGCTITVNLTAATAGTHNNNIPAGALKTNWGNNALPANASLTVSTQGYITGRVFKDNEASPNGSYDTGDDPILGASIELRAGADCSGAPASTASTDNAGNYAFTGLAAGTWSVCQAAQPTGTLNGTTTAGIIASVSGSTGTAGSASNPTGSTSQIVGIVLNGDGTGGTISGSTGNDFAEVAPAGISGTVFKDVDNDGVKETGDSVIAGVSIELRAGNVDCSGAAASTTTTDSSGNYAFSNLAPGTYTVCEPSQPAGTSNGITSAGTVENGTAGTPSAATSLPSRIAGIVLPPGVTTSGNNFAELPHDRSLAGRVFVDLADNGAFDGADTGIASQTLNLTGIDVNGNAVSMTTTTAADGTYGFTLPAGTHAVTQPLPQPADTENGITSAGSTGGTATPRTTTPSVISGIDLTGSNINSTGNNFAEINTAATEADLAVTKTDGLTEVNAGATLTYTIVVNNAGPAAADNAVFKDAAVANLTVTGVTCASPTNGAACPTAGNTTVALMQGTGIVIPTLPSGGGVTFSVTGTAGASGTIANTATITPPTGVTDPTPGNNEQTDTDTINPRADLAITKADGVASVDAGGTVTYTIQVTNAGPSAANDAVFKDAAVANLTVTGVTCASPTNGAACPTAGNTTVALMQGAGIVIPTLPSGGGVTFTVTGTAGASGEIVNTATITPPTGVTDPTPGNNEATDTDTIDPRADLSITKTDGVTSVNAGGTVTYTIQVTNAGPSAANDAVFKDAQVANLTVTGVTCASPTNGAACPTAGNTTVALMQAAGIVIPTLPSGGGVTFTVTGTAGASGEIVNTATITPPTGVTDPTPGNNTATDTDTNNPLADLAVTKTDGVASVDAGGTLTYTINVTNAGPSAANDAVFKDAAVANLAVTGVTCASPINGAACPTAGNTTVALMQGTGIVIPTLPSGGAVTFTVTGTAGASGEIVNKATITPPTGVTDPTPGNNEATDTDTITPVIDLALDKTVDNPTPNVGGTVTFTVTLNNAGPSAASGVAVTDQLPAGYTFVSATPAPGTTHVSATGLWTVGALAKDASASLTIQATVNASGPYVNTAEVTAATEQDQDSTPNNHEPTEDDQHSATTTPVPVIDLSLDKTVDNPTPEVGGTVKFTVTVSNAGPSAATGVVVTDKLTAGYGFVQATASQGGHVSDTGVWTVGGLAKDATATLTIEATVNASGPYDNTAEVTAATETDPDSTPDNHVATEDDQKTVTPVPNTRVSGKVYHDVNEDGDQDAGEPGLGQVSLTLTGKDHQGNDVSRTTTTGVDGGYSFTGLPPSDATGYTVTETQPAGIDDFPAATGSAVGSVNGAASGIAALNAITGIVLTPGAAGVGYDFREDAASLLGGSVYLDDGTGGGTIDNGLRDGGEKGIAGVVITLTGGVCADGTGSCTVTTDADGNYRFDGLRAGTYTLTETHPVTYEDARETAGSVGGAVDNASFGSDAAHNRITGVALGAGSQASGYLFGELNGVVARVSGRAWVNTDSTGAKGSFDANDSPLAGWTVELVHDGNVVGNATTGADGTYKITSVTPDYNYSVRFRNPANGLVWGYPVANTGGNGAVNKDKGTIEGVTVPSNGSVDGLDLPVDPAGVVYDAVSRAPIAGATVVLSYAGAGVFVPATHVIGGSATQVTGADGLYQFFLTPTAPDGAYSLTVSHTAYKAGVSTLIPPQAGTSEAGFAAGGAPVPIQAQATAPTGAQPTVYWLSFHLANTSAGVVNNHIPLDPLPAGAITMTKTTPKLNVAKGDLVPYVITATNTEATPLAGVDITDQMPPGFKYQSGSASVNGVAAAPTQNDRVLTWAGLAFAAGEKKTIKLMLMVGAGVGEGQYDNQAWAQSGGVRLSNVATATVRIVPDPTFDCADLIGKVFDDRNANGYEDAGEPGIPNVRLATARGLLVTTDKDGRFHVACAVVPQAQRGSNFIMKLDERTLPSGYRITTENPREARMTRGKLAKLNFGAAIHRVVRLELSDRAFQAGGTEPAEALAAALTKLPDTLRAKPSVLRLAYQVGGEGRELAQARLRAVRDKLERLWKASGCCHSLQFEDEIFERSPARKGGVK